MHWKTKLPGVKNAVLLSQTTRPNPLIAGNFIFASVWAPGTVCAVGRESGDLLWKRELDSYASASVLLHTRVLYASSARTLYALDPISGSIRWQFSPKPDPGEWIYSQPAVKAGRLFIGDRCGNLHCLDAKTGKTIWRRQTSRGENNQVNATALIAGNRVITANNQGAVVCYSVEAGATLWRQKVDGSCISELLRFQSKAVVAAKSLYIIDLESGAIHTELNFPAKAVQSVAVSGSRIAVVLGTDFQAKPSAWNQASAFNGELLILERGREIARRTLSGTPVIRIDPQTGLIYAVSPSEMAIIDSSDASVLKTRRGEFSLPDISNGQLFELSRDGELVTRTLSQI
jgi:hypothetical protein